MQTNNGDFSMIRKTPIKTRLLSFFMSIWLLLGSAYSYSETTILDPQALQVKAYCAEYVKAVAVAFLGKQHRVQITDLKQEHWARILGNVFQPPSAKITASYHCQFSLHGERRIRSGNVNLLLITNKDFAEHTAWKSIQVIQQGQIVVDGRRYFIVPKYLAIDDRFMHVKENRQRIQYNDIEKDTSD